MRALVADEDIGLSSAPLFIPIVWRFNVSGCVACRCPVDATSPVRLGSPKTLGTTGITSVSIDPAAQIFLGTLLCAAMKLPCKLNSLVSRRVVEQMTL